MKVINSEGGVYNKIIKAFDKRYGLGNWTVEFTDITPEEAYETLKEYVRYEHGDDTYLMGAAYPNKKHIWLFFGGVKSYGQKTYTLAHELAHAAHYQTIPESNGGWSATQQEEFADRVANEVLDDLGV